MTGILTTKDAGKRIRRIVVWSLLWCGALTIFGACQPCFTGVTVDTETAFLGVNSHGKVSLFPPGATSSADALPLLLPLGASVVKTPVAVSGAMLVYRDDLGRTVFFGHSPETVHTLPLDSVLPPDAHIWSLCPTPGGVYLNVGYGSYWQQRRGGVLHLNLSTRKLRWVQDALEVRTNGSGASYAAFDRDFRLCRFEGPVKTVLRGQESMGISSWDYDPATGRTAVLVKDRVTVLDKDGKPVFTTGSVGFGINLYGVRLPSAPGHPLWLLEQRIPHVHGVMELSEKGEVRGWRNFTSIYRQPEFVQNIDDKTYRWLAGFTQSRR